MQQRRVRNPFVSPAIMPVDAIASSRSNCGSICNNADQYPAWAVA
ncbi:MAG: hypothetical protein V3Q69_01800 [Burkholderia sp.]